MHDDGDESLSSSTLLEALLQVQQLRDSGQQYVDTPQYSNLIAILKTKPVSVLGRVVGSGSGNASPLSLLCRSSADLAEHTPSAQVGTNQAAADNEHRQVQNHAYRDHALHPIHCPAQGSVEGHQAANQTYPQVGASTESKGNMNLRDQNSARQASHWKSQELKVMQQLQVGPIVQNPQLYSHEMRTGEEGRIDTTAQQQQRRLQANSCGSLLDKGESTLNLPHRTKGGSSQSLQTPLSSNSQMQIRILEHMSQGSVSSHEQLASHHIPHLQAHLAVIQTGSHGGSGSPQQGLLVPHVIPSTLGQDMRHSSGGNISIMQECPAASFSASSTHFGSAHSSGSSGPFLSTAGVGATLSCFPQLEGQIVDTTADKPSLNGSRLQLSVVTTLGSAPATSSVKTDVLPRSNSQTGPGGFSSHQSRQSQQQNDRSGMSSSGESSLRSCSEKAKQLQQSQQSHQQQVLHHMQQQQASLPQKCSEEATSGTCMQGRLQQQQVFRSNLPPLKANETLFPGLSQQPQQEVHQLQQWQHQQVVLPNLSSHMSAESCFSGPRRQSQQQQLLQLQLDHPQVIRAGVGFNTPSEASPSSYLQQTEQMQQFEQHKQKLQQHHQNKQSQEQYQHQQLQEQQVVLQERDQHFQQQQQFRQKQGQQHLLQKQLHQQQILQKQHEQRQLQQKQQHQQLLLQQNQPRHAPYQQNLLYQEVGFTQHQLYVLRSQILAFRRIKKNERLSDELLRAITPMALHSSVAHQPLLLSSLSAVIDRSPSSGFTFGSLVPLQAGISRASELEGDQAKTVSSMQGIYGENRAVGKMVASPSVLNDDSSVVSRPSRTGANLAAVPVQQNGQVSAKHVKAETEDGVEVESSQKLHLITGKKLDLSGTPPLVPSMGTLKTAHQDASNVTNFQKDTAMFKSHRGPLYYLPSMEKAKLEISGGHGGLWDEAVVLGYDVRVLLLEEGVRVVDLKRGRKLKSVVELLAAGSKNKELSSDLSLKLRIEQRKLHLMELQSRIRDEVEEQQQEIMSMGERAYRKFVRLCERQRGDLSRQVIMLQKASREKQLKVLFQWRKKFLEAQWGTRDFRVSRNRGVAKYHERMLREFSKKKDDDRTKRMEALKNNDVDAYREMLRQQQTQMPGDAGERFEVLSSFLTQTEEYLHNLGGKISAVKNQQEREEAALFAAAAARAQGLSEEEVEQAAVRAGEEVSARGWAEDNNSFSGTSVNSYYSLAHAVNEHVLRQPSMLRAGTLRDYQLVGLQWMLSLYNNRLNGILADEMGLGKTVQVMALIAYLMEFKGNYGPHLIIVPNAVIVNWKSELVRWLPAVSCIFFVGGKDARTKIFTQEVMAMKFNILVTTYEFIMRDRAKLSKVDWKYMIIDEAQRMKDRESRLARDLDRFRCQRRLLLTGTPLQNDLTELWSLLNLLLPDVFDSSKAFNDWFAKPFQRDALSGQSDEDDWLETEKKVIVIHRLHQILEPFMLRRRVEDVEGSLPPKVVVVLKCRLSGFQAAIYDWVKSTATIRLDPLDEAQRVYGNSKRQIRAYAPLQNKCMELRKICNHPYLNYPPRSAVPSNTLVRCCGKLWILDRILIKLHRTGHRVLLFSTMTRLLDILEEYLQWRRLRYRRIDGTTTLDAREAAIVDFNSPRSEVFLFLLSIRAAGRGLNLQSADTVVIYDPDPNPKNEEQAVARAHRIGQKREVRVIYLEAVVETQSSYQKEDALRSGGDVGNDDEMAGKDRYMGSVESLVRNNIQQHKIDMADEVINAGRFDQRTSQEERRLTLEALLHDEERYQKTVHDVPTLHEVNRMIARTDKEVELFDQMDEEENWAGDLLEHHHVPEWLRVGSHEVMAAMSATSKQALKQGVTGVVGTKEGEEKSVRKAVKLNALSLKRKAESDNAKAVATSPKYKAFKIVKPKKALDMERASQSDGPDHLNRNADEAFVMDDKLANDKEEEDARPVCTIVCNRVELEEGEMEEESVVANEGESTFEEGLEELGGEVGDKRHSTSLLPNGGDMAKSGLPVYATLSATQNGHSRSFKPLAAICGRPIKHDEEEGLEEGEIAVSGDESLGGALKAGNWVYEREGGEENLDAQPQQRKRKRSNRHRRIAPFVEPSEQSSGGVDGNSLRFPFRSQFPRCNQRTPQVQRVSDTADVRYERHSPWGGLSAYIKQVAPESSSGRPFENSMITHGPRVDFKHTWANGFQEPVEDARLAHANVLVHGNALAHSSLLAHNSALTTWNATARMPENQQKKCKAVLGKLRGAVSKEGSGNADLFMEFPKRTDCPDYYKVITRPIDARTVEDRLEHFEYPGVLDFAADVQLMLYNAARYFCTFEVQADARRLQALFFQRMGLQFPDVDFSPVRTKILVVPEQRAPGRAPACASRKVECVDSDEAPRAGGEGVASTATRGRSARTSVKQGNVSAEMEIRIRNNPSLKDKKSKKGKDVKKIEEPDVANNVVEEKRKGGPVHPVDLVVIKKKRNGRERMANKVSNRKSVSVGHTKEAVPEPSASYMRSSTHSTSHQMSPEWHRKLLPGHPSAENSGFPVVKKVGKRSSKPKLNIFLVDNSEKR